MWNKNPNFKKFLNLLWKNPTASNVNLNGICNLLANQIPKWPLKDLHETNEQIQNLTKELEVIDSKIHLNRIVFGPLEMNLGRQIKDLLTLKATFWAQRAKRNWIQNVDQNSKYFHALASHQKRKNLIQGIKNDNNNWIFEESRICNEFFSFFKN